MGWEYARQIAERRSHNLVLVARRSDRLEELQRQIEHLWQASNTELVAEVATCDLSDPGARQQLCESVATNYPNINLLVNNAGFGSLGPFGQSDLQWEQQMVELNCIAPLTLCRHFGPLMQRNGGGSIINVCSTAAFNPMPYMATYGATKAFLLSLSLALDCEFRATSGKARVRVMAHCPGPTTTEFHLVVGLKDKMDFLPAEPAKKVVHDALRAAEKGSAILINGKLNFCLAQLNRLMPQRLAALLVERILRKSAHEAESKILTK